MAMGSILGKIIPGFEIPNAVLILVWRGHYCHLILYPYDSGTLHLCSGQQRRSHPPFGCQCGSLEDCCLYPVRLFRGLAGVLIASRLNSAQPALGAGYELDAIAAVVIGGTSLSGGEGSILGTIIGAFIISTLTNGLRILSVPQEWQMVVTGGIVVMAVYLDILRRRRK